MSCMICEKNYGNTYFKHTFYPTNQGHFAHLYCYNLIKECEKSLIEKMHIFESSEHQNRIHRDGVAIVKKQLGGRSIEKFLYDEGPIRLKQLFDSAAESLSKPVPKSCFGRIFRYLGLN